MTPEQMTEDSPITIEVPLDMAGKRIDQVIAHFMSDYSRSRLQQWMKAGFITVEGKIPKTKDKVHGGEIITVELGQALATAKPDEKWDAQPLPLNIVHEDDALLVIYKPVGLVVHPGAGNLDGTLVNALVHHEPSLANIPRAGVIHRLDKDTSGLLVIAKTLPSHHALTQLLQAREFTREYQAVVYGVMTGGGTVDQPIGRHPSHRVKMAVLPHSSTAKEAITHYRVATRYRAHTLLNVKLETGRTHQIRVHLSHQKYPLVGDSVYGGRLRLPSNATEEFVETLRQFKRQALHARLLGLVHPETGEYIEWAAEMPTDMQNLIQAMEKDLAQRV